MKNLVSAILISSLCIMPAIADESIEFKPLKRPVLQINLQEPEVYKPTKLIIGQETKFIIKADPGCFASLATSYSNTGAPLFYGNKLRLGANFSTKEAQVPDNGLLEISVSLPNDKELKEKTLYFEVAVWKDRDFNDLKLARIMAPNGKETENNSIKISLPPEDASKLMFAPTLPGATPEMFKTIETIEKIKSGEYDDENAEVDFIKDGSNISPMMLRSPIDKEINK